MDVTVANAAQDQLVVDIQAVIDQFKADNPDITLRNLNFDTYNPDDEKAIHCTISYSDDSGANLTRSV